MTGVVESLKEEWRALLFALSRIPRGARRSMAAVCLLFVLWSWGGLVLPEATLPSPLEVAEAFAAMLADPMNEFARATGSTLGIYLAGFGAAIIFGNALALLMRTRPLIESLVSPLVDLVGSVPNIAFMPLMVALLGLGALPKAAIVFIACVLPVIVTGHAALRNVDRTYHLAAQGLGARPLTSLLRIVWPLAVPSMLAGMRIAALQGLAAIVVAEIYTAMTGLGGLLVGYGNAFRMSRYMVVVLTLALIGALVSGLLRSAERAAARRMGLT